MLPAQKQSGSTKNYKKIVPLILNGILIIVYGALIDAHNILI